MKGLVSGCLTNQVLGGSVEENYSSILKVDRLRDSSRGGKSILQESESDRARVLYSAAFRRLQRKTQVFPLEENAAIRSRLTHSLEVAHVGRFLATSFLKKVSEGGHGKSKGQLGINEECALAIPNIVETACLLHDIGNPPFGHFGESAISNWFTGFLKRSGDKFKSRESAKLVEADLAAFDGNPQGLRLITKLSGIDDHGMNLTVTQAASTVKYPVEPKDINKNDPLRKKAGVFHSESQVWSEIRQRLGMNYGQRFPLAYLMEAADDISYCLSDIEDGVEKGFFSHQLFVDSVMEGVNGNPEVESIVKDAIDGAKRNNKYVDETVFFRSQLVTYLVSDMSSTYVKEHEKIFDGSLSGLVEASENSSVLLKSIKKSVFKLLYGRRSSLELELTGLAAINGILQRYESLIELGRDEFDQILQGKKCERHLDAEVKIFSLLAPKHISAYKRSVDAYGDSEEYLARVHLIVDFVSGMTDVFALRTYQMFSGIKL